MLEWVHLHPPLTPSTYTLHLHPPLTPCTYTLHLHFTYTLHIHPPLTLSTYTLHLHFTYTLHLHFTYTLHIHSPLTPSTYTLHLHPPHTLSTYTLHLHPPHTLSTCTLHLHFTYTLHIHSPLTPSTYTLHLHPALTPSTCTLHLLSLYLHVDVANSRYLGQMNIGLSHNVRPNSRCQCVRFPPIMAMLQLAFSHSCLVCVSWWLCWFVGRRTMKRGFRWPGSTWTPPARAPVPQEQGSSWNFDGLKGVWFFWCAVLMPMYIHKQQYINKHLSLWADMVCMCINMKCVTVSIHTETPTY